MRNTIIRTSDIFEYKDVEKRMRYFNFCRKKALKYGLTCRSHIGSKDATLFMDGRKINFIRYYLATVFKTEDKIMDGVKRIISIIFT